jgi:hypothetical protein
MCFVGEWMQLLDQVNCPESPDLRELHTELERS